MANTPLSGYPNSIGSRTRLIFDHTGPTSYGNIGTSSGSGDIINATDLGFGAYETIGMAFGAFCEGYSQSGNFVVKMFTSSTGTTPSMSFGAGIAIPKIVLQWFTTASAFGAISTEVANTTNLSAETLRLDCTML